MPHVTWLSMHGALTHFPIAMLIAAFLFELGSVLFKKPDWRPVSFWLLVTGVAGAAPSLLTGWMVGNEMYGHTASPPAVFTTHRLMAFATSIAALLLLLWRIAIKDRAAGGLLAASLIAGLVVFCGVSYTGYLGGEMTLGGADSGSTQAAPAPASSAAPVKLDPLLVARGKAAYAKNGCSACHRIDGAGGHGGPDLSHEGSRRPDVAWQVAHLKNPSKMKPGSAMPPYDTLSTADLNAIAQYVVSHR